MNNVKIKTIVTRHQKQVFFMAGRPQRASSAGAQAGGAGAQAGDPQRASSAGAQARGRQQKASSAGAQARGRPQRASSAGAQARGRHPKVHKTRGRHPKQRAEGGPRRARRQKQVWFTARGRQGCCMACQGGPQASAGGAAGPREAATAAPP